LIGKCFCPRVEHRTIEKAHGQTEIREYYQTEDVDWIADKKKWKNLKSIGMVVTTTKKNDIESTEIRYFISSLAVMILLFAKAVRGHWAIESMHWHLDVTFREDSCKTLESTAAQNLNILRKIALSILKVLDVGKKCSLKRKRFIVCSNASIFLRKIMDI